MVQMVQMVFDRAIGRAISSGMRCRILKNQLQNRCDRENGKKKRSTNARFKYPIVRSAPDSHRSSVSERGAGRCAGCCARSCVRELCCLGGNTSMTP